MSYADLNAVIAVVQSVPILASKTYTGEAASATHLPISAPYAVIHAGAGKDRQDRFAAGKIENPRFTGHLVGVDATQCVVLLDLVKAKFMVNGLGITMTVAGRRNHRVWFETPIPVQIDKSAGKSVPFAVFELGWHSEPV